MNGEYFVESCGTKDHEGRRKHKGALLNWRRRLRGARRRVYFNNIIPDYVMALKQRVEMGIGDLDRRILALNLRIERPRQFDSYKYCPRLLVLGKDTSGIFEPGGPVGKAYRGPPKINLKTLMDFWATHAPGRHIPKSKKSEPERESNPNSRRRMFRVTWRSGPSRLAVQKKRRRG